MEGSLLSRELLTDTHVPEFIGKYHWLFFFKKGKFLEKIIISIVTKYNNFWEARYFSLQIQPGLL